MSIYLSTGLTIYACFVVFLLGIVMGSFLNCASIRVLNGESIARGRSHCMSCNHQLGALDLIPLFSWIFLRGKCRYCGEKISARYPLTEAIMGLLYVAILLRFDISLEALEYAILVSLLLCVTLCDFEEYIIPDRFIVIGIITRIIFVHASEDIGGIALESVIGAFSISLPVLIITLVMEKILGKDAMGGGDIKLLFMLGMYFPWKVNVLGLLIACVVGIIFGVLGKKNSEKQIPFGPAISIAWTVCIFVGSEIVSWYISLF